MRFTIPSSKKKKSSLFLPSLVCLFVEFWCFEAPGLKCPRLEFSGCRVKPHDSPRAQTCTFQAPAFKNTHKIQREDPKVREERVKIVAGEGKKRAKFWAVRRRGVRQIGGPPEGRVRREGGFEGGFGRGGGGASRLKRRGASRLKGGEGFKVEGRGASRGGFKVEGEGGGGVRKGGLRKGRAERSPPFNPSTLRAPPAPHHRSSPLPFTPSPSTLKLPPLPLRFFLVSFCFSVWFFFRFFL